MIPSIDIAPLFAAAPAARDAVDRAILQAAGETGFMTVTGLPGTALAPATRRRLLAIFTLPETQKRAMSRRSFVAGNANIYRGWFPLQDGHPTYKEGTDLGPGSARF